MFSFGDAFGPDAAVLAGTACASDSTLLEGVPSGETASLLGGDACSAGVARSGAAEGDIVASCSAADNTGCGASKRSAIIAADTASKVVRKRGGTL